MHHVNTIIIIDGWERKRPKCFFTYIHLDLFRSHPSNYKWVLTEFLKTSLQNYRNPGIYSINVFFSNNRENQYISHWFLVHVFNTLGLSFTTMLLYLYRKKWRWINPYHAEFLKWNKWWPPTDEHWYCIQCSCLLNLLLLFQKMMSNSHSMGTVVLKKAEESFMWGSW